MTNPGHDSVIYDSFIAVWNDGRTWVFSIDPCIPAELRQYAEKAAIRRCEQLIAEEEASA